MLDLAHVQLSPSLDYCSQDFGGCVVQPPQLSSLFYFATEGRMGGRILCAPESTEVMIAK